MRRMWPALLLMLAVAATLAWLAVGAPTTVGWAVYGFWAAIAIALIARIAVGISRRTRTGSAPRHAPSRRPREAEPADLKPVVRGPDTSPITMVGPDALDPFEQQLRQLRHRDERRG